MSNAPTAEFKAAIDIGTNSMHLVVARLAEHGGFEMLTTEKDMVRLGEGRSDMTALAPAAIERGIDALARMKEVAASFGPVDLAAVATSAVREAHNRAEFLDRARDELDIDVQVISGFEEARLIHLGVLQALPVFDERLLVVDIGGGSTEFCIGHRGEVIEARSMKLGAIRLTERFFTGVTDVEHDGAVSGKAVKECRKYVRSALAPVAHELGGHQPGVAVGSSGTVSTVASMALAARDEKSRQLNGVGFGADELAAIVKQLTSTTTGERRRLSGLDEKRVDIIVAGAILLEEIFRAFGIERMTVSDYALREGVLFDRFGTDSIRALQDLRTTNLLRLARQLDPDPEHAVHTARLATELFDRTTAVHGLAAPERELLEAAALVHNVGLFISHSSHHKHSYYVIRNSEQLTGFTEHEIELIAVIARYHRKSRPTEKHAEFAALSKRDRAMVGTLAGILRIAIGLDRRHAASVRSVRVFVDDGLYIEPIGADGVDLDVEIYAARARSGLLADALGVEVRIERPTLFDTSDLST